MLGCFSPGAIARTAPPHSRCPTSACCCDRLNLNNFSRLWVAAIRCHSPFTFSSPRNRKRRRPLASFICPFTGSTTALRWAEMRLPFLLLSFRTMRALESASLGIGPRFGGGSWPVGQAAGGDIGIDAPITAELGVGLAPVARIRNERLR